MDASSLASVEAGEAAFAQGSTDAAAEHYEKALAGCSRASHTCATDCTFTLSRLSVCHQRRGDLQAGLRLIQKAVRIAGALDQSSPGVAHELTLCQRDLGALYEKLGRTTEAIAALEGTVTNANRLGMIDIIAAVKCQLVAQFRLTGQLTKALAALSEIEMLSSRSPSTHAASLAKVACGRASIFADQGRHQEALVLLGRPG